MKTMGFTRLILVKPSKLAVPEHEMAYKMAVKSWDVLYRARIVPTLAEATQGMDKVLATTSRRGVSGVREPRELATELVADADQGKRVAILFGNEKTGLLAEDVALAHQAIRIPMAADQPSVNLAQSVQILAYELLTSALSQRTLTATGDVE